MHKQIIVLTLCLFVIYITNNNDKLEFIPDITKYQNDVLVIVTPWCDICTETKKILQKSNMPISYYNLSACSQPFLVKYAVVGVPTFLYIKNGQVIHKDVGIEDQSTLFDKVNILYNEHIESD